MILHCARPAFAKAAGTCGRRQSLHFETMSLDVLPELIPWMVYYTNTGNMTSRDTRSPLSPGSLLARHSGASTILPSDDNPGGQAIGTRSRLSCFGSC